MQSALDRRQAILEILSDRRQESVANLMHELSVSRRTILRDIEILSCSAPIYTVQGNGGGIRVEGSYYVGRRYLKPEQAALLDKLASSLEGNELEVMSEILKQFAPCSRRGR
jgi:predicted DNA-binding transcriptional regulator YafY